MRHRHTRAECDIKRPQPHLRIWIEQCAGHDLAGIRSAGAGFKQIIIAAGEGARAALSAFDYLIRLAPVEKAAEAA